MIPVNRPLITAEDVSFVKGELEAGFISGEIPLISKLETEFSEYIGVKESVAVSNGTVALDLLLSHSNLSEKNTVIVPSFTIISTINQLVRDKVKIIFVDSQHDTWNMNVPEALSIMEEHVTGVLPVHIYGLPVDMDPLLSRAREIGAFVFEDAAEALGVTYKGRKVGGLGDASTFSFYANKILTGGEGGMISTNDSPLATKLRNLRTLNFETGNRFVSQELGWNARIHGLSAALIYSQLNRLDSLVKRKQKIASTYLSGLLGHPWFEFQMDSTPYSSNTYWVFGILLNEEAPFTASEFQELLRRNGIDSRRFFCPMHLQPVLQDYNFVLSSNMRVSEKLWTNGLYLPSGLGTTELEQSQVIDLLWSLVTKKNEK